MLASSLLAAMNLPAIKRAAGTALCASLGLAIFSCAPQSSVHPPPDSVPSTSNDVCQVNPAWICQNTHGPKLSVDHALAEQMNSRIEYFSWVYGPHHKLLVEVRCEVDRETQAVQHAAVVSGPPLTSKDIDFLRRAGLCEAP